MTFLDVEKRECEVNISLVVVVKVVMVRGGQWVKKLSFLKQWIFLSYLAHVFFNILHFVFKPYKTIYHVYESDFSWLDLMLFCISIMCDHVICLSCCSWFMSPTIWLSLEHFKLTWEQKFQEMQHLQRKLVRLEKL